MVDRKFTLASQDHIGLYEDTGRRFFREVLDMRSDECLLTDESRLADFASCGLPDALADATSSLKELYAAWDIWVLGELDARYGLRYESTAVPLLTLFRDLEVHWARRPH